MSDTAKCIQNVLISLIAAGSFHTDPALAVGLDDGGQEFGPIDKAISKRHFNSPAIDILLRVTQSNITDMVVVVAENANWLAAGHHTGGRVEHNFDATSRDATE